VGRIPRVWSHELSERGESERVGPRYVEEMFTWQWQKQDNSDMCIDSLNLQQYLDNLDIKSFNTQDSRKRMPEMEQGELRGRKSMAGEDFRFFCSSYDCLL
jgi:hypothetical protein